PHAVVRAGREGAGLAALRRADGQGEEASVICCYPELSSPPAPFTVYNSGGGTAAMPSAMTREDDFLQAILADPEATDTWLVLADWLEENGQDARSELLRLQFKLRNEANLRARSPLEKRVRTLLAGHIKPCVPILENSIGMRFAL